MKKTTLLISFLATCFQLFAQPEVNLAQQYMNMGEYEKALALYEKLSKENPTSDYYFDQTLKANMELRQFKEAEDAIKKRIKAFPKNVSLYVSMGTIMEKQDKEEDANKFFKKAVETLTNDQGEIVRLAYSFQNGGKTDFAIATYEAGHKLTKDPSLYAFELGGLYYQKGDVNKMMDNFILSVKNVPQRMTNVQASLQRVLAPADYTTLQTKLMEQAQSDESNMIWPEMLAWTFVQKKDYKNAFRQITAIDRRQQENGGRVFRLAGTAMKEKDYDAAIEGLAYIIEKKGQESPFYYDAMTETLRAKQLKITEGYNYTPADLQSLEKDYHSFLGKLGENKQTVPIMSAYANFEAFYMNNLDSAIAIMTRVTEIPFAERNSQDQDRKAQAKLDLGDFYLMAGELWESMLLYGQVDKQMKDAPLGEMARFKNAKLAYYRGDFDWAQGQLGALKASTSELISNDAIDLSVFIMEHFGLDTIATPMELFAKADLLVFQNKFDESFIVMDTIKRDYPHHLLEDDMVLLQANIHIKRQKYPEAIKLLENIVENYKDGILVDNAIYKMAQLYENQLKDKDKAMAMYEKIISDFASSIFVVEARKRFRILRGDNLDGVQ
jgi:tetratricopeptide (TPR) repeat protein